MEITGNYRQLPGAIIRYRVTRVQAAVRQYTWLTIRASRPVAVVFRVAVDARRETATERLLVATSRRARRATAPTP